MQTVPESSRPSPRVVEIRDEPDEPVGWGTKSWWIVTRAPSAQALAGVLGRDSPCPSNWESGLTAAETYPSNYVFVTPPVEGWTLAVGVGLPDPGDRKLLPVWRSLTAAVSERFGDTWFFATQRASMYSAWARYSHGEERRLSADEALGVIYDLGEMLPEEEDLVRRFRRSASAQGELDEEDIFWPEEDVSCFVCIPRHR